MEAAADAAPARRRLPAVLLVGLFLLAVAGTFVSAYVHAASYFDLFLIKRHPGLFFWPHLLIFPPFIAVILEGGNEKAGRLERRWKTILSTGALRRNRALRLSTALGGCIGLYLIVNFFVGYSDPQETHPLTSERGPFMIRERGAAQSRAVGEEEYYAVKNREVRMMSGHWLLFYSVTAFFLGHILVDRWRGLRPPGDADTDGMK